MVQRLTYRRRLSYNTKSNRKRMWVAWRVNVTFYYDHFVLPLKLKWTVNIILIYLFCSLLSLSAAPRLLVSLFWIFISFVTRANCDIVFRWLRKDRHIFSAEVRSLYFEEFFLKYCFLDVSLHCQFVWEVVSLTALYIFCRAIRILGSILIVLSDCPGENAPSISLGSENVCNTTIVPFQGDINQTTQSSVSFFLKPFFVLLFFSISLPIYVQLILFLRRKVGLLVHKEARQGSKMWRLPKETPRSE